MPAPPSSHPHGWRCRPSERGRGAQGSRARPAGPPRRCPGKMYESVEVGGLAPTPSPFLVVDFYNQNRACLLPENGLPAPGPYSTPLRTSLWNGSNHCRYRPRLSPIVGARPCMCACVCARGVWGVQETFCSRLPQGTPAKCTPRFVPCLLACSPKLHNTLPGPFPGSGRWGESPTCGLALSQEEGPRPQVPPLPKPGGGPQPSLSRHSRQVPGAPLSCLGVGTGVAWQAGTPAGTPLASWPLPWPRSRLPLGWDL